MAQLDEQVNQNTQIIQAVLDAAKKISELPPELAEDIKDNDLFVIEKDSNGVTMKIKKSELNKVFGDSTDGIKQQITLSNPYELTELNLISNPVDEQQVTVTNYLNDRVLFQYDAFTSSWIRKSNLNISCVVRLNTTVDPPMWYLLDDEGHTPIGVTGITNYADGAAFNFSIQYPNSDKVGTILSTNDETYAQYGITHGASVSTDEAFFQINKVNFAQRLIISGGVPVFASDTGDLIKPPTLVSVWNAVDERIDVTWPDITATGGIVYDRQPVVVSTNQTLRAVVVANSPSGFSVEFYNRSDNTKRTTLTTLMRFELFMSGSFKMPNSIIPDNGNIWIKGTMNNTPQGSYELPPVFETSFTNVGVGNTSFNFDATLRRAGTIYGVAMVMPVETAPSVAQVIAGLDSSGFAAISSDNSLTPATLNFTGLTPGTMYNFYIAAEDLSGQVSTTTLKIQFSTTELP